MYNLCPGQGFPPQLAWPWWGLPSAEANCPPPQVLTPVLLLHALKSLRPLLLYSSHVVLRMNRLNVGDQLIHLGFEIRCPRRGLVATALRTAEQRAEGSHDKMMHLVLELIRPDSLSWGY